MKPSFEEEEDLGNNASTNQIIKDKKKILPKNNLSSAKFIGLDKITAKTSEIIVNLGETKKFGPLEIKVLKCGEIDNDNKDKQCSLLTGKRYVRKSKRKSFYL